MPSGRLKNIDLIQMVAVLCVYAGAGIAGEMSPGHLAAEISSITYRDNDEYLVEITMTGRSGRTADLDGYETSFSAQSEILGRWIELDHRITAGPGCSAEGTAPDVKILKITAIVTIPLAIPHLYKNHDGDVNMRFRYTLTYAGIASPGDDNDAGESAYWVTPRTDRWVLREGM